MMMMIMMMMNCCLEESRFFSFSSERLFSSSHLRHAALVMQAEVSAAPDNASNSSQDVRTASHSFNTAGLIAVLSDFDDKASDFYRKATWSPDGSCILATTESQCVQILQLSLTVLGRVGSVRSPSPLLEAVWYPMPADTPTSAWCFLEAHRDLPIRLMNSVDMSTMASYSIMNHVEKYVAPHAMALSPDLSRLYCGMWSALAVVPLSLPGLNTHSNLPLTPKKSGASGQKGVVSALATAAHPTQTGQDMIAVGTYFGSVGVYAILPSALPAPMQHTVNARQDLHARDFAQQSCLAGWREVDGEGITQLRFHPLTPYVLFVSSRKSSYIYAYDLRYLFGGSNRWKFPPQTQPSRGQRSGAMLARFFRPACATHQRLAFDIAQTGHMLASGDEHGVIRIWNIHGGRFTEDCSDADKEDDGTIDTKPRLEWNAHDGE